MDRIFWAGALALLCGAVAALPLPAQEAHLLVVTGIGGADDRARAFHEWATDLVSAAVERHGVAAERITYLSGDPEVAGAAAAGRSSAETVEAELRRLSTSAGADDLVMIVLIGHGSFRDNESNFNLPGPDLSAADFGALLDAFTTQRIVFVNTTSASGGFVEALAGPNRTIVTATKTPRERNETVFGRYFVNAFTGESADTDKDGRISVLEAFEFARHEVQRSYEERGVLLTEHALLEDDGDGVGAEEPDPEAGEGQVARTLFLASTKVAIPEGASPELRALYERRAQIQSEVDALRARKSQMDEAEYQRQLEALLLEMARVNRAIREAGGGGAGAP